MRERGKLSPKGLLLIELKIFKKEAIVQADLLLLTAAHSACTNSLACNYLHSFFHGHLPFSHNQRVLWHTDQ